MTNPDGMKIPPTFRVVIELSPTTGLNVDLPDDPLMAFGLLEAAKAVVYQRMNVKQSSIVRPR